MKIILSRKGFDSSAGGCPSPILPDGQLLSLPIPDAQSPTRYADLGLPSGLLEDLTHRRIKLNHGAHLDPDINPQTLSRKRHWRALFGQFGAAQSHLRNQGVGPGDLFLFFGLFRNVEYAAEGWRWSDAPPRHILWGWLQVDEIWPVLSEFTLPLWARTHPHANRRDLSGNTLYVARHTLNLPDDSTDRTGAGVFRKVAPALQLTAPTARTVSQWRLPRWFFPSQSKPPLSYHQRPERWRQKPRWCELQAAARGQEFVLDSAHYPDAPRWASELITHHG